MAYKTVLLPIQVPEGEYCWDDKSICPHYDNEGGHRTCDFNFDLRYTVEKPGHIKKPKECNELKEKH